MSWYLQSVVLASYRIKMRCQIITPRAQSHTGCRRYSVECPITIIFECLLMKLYRKEVLTAQGDQLQGRIIIARSFSSWILFAGAVLTVICFVSFLCTASYKKRADAQGILVLGDGAVPIISPTTGRIKAVLVSEGQAVSKGDYLFVISNERVLGRGANNNVADKMRVEIESQIDSLELEVKQIKLVQRQDSVGRLAERKTLKRDLKLVASQLVITESRMKLAQARLHEFNQLNKTLIVSNQFIQEQVDNVAAINIQLITFRRQRAEIERNLGRLEVEELQSPVQADLKLSNLDRELSVRRQKIVEQYAQDEWIVAAPIDGELTSITAIEGQIAATQTLGVLLPKNSNLSAQLFVDSKNVGFLTSGEKSKVTV